MAQSYLQRVADELADLALADQEASGNVGIVDMIGDVLGASSQTLQETFLTSIRVRRAETRARAMLAQRKANNYSDKPKPELEAEAELKAEKNAEKKTEEKVEKSTAIAKPEIQKAPAAKEEVTKQKTVVKKTIVKKTVAKKAVAKKVAKKKISTKTAPAKKIAVKKAPSKKSSPAGRRGIRLKDDS